MHVDARDFVRGTRPWDQFLNYCDTLAQEEGGRFWEAQICDPRYEGDIEAKLAELEAKGSSRPPLAGHTAEIRALYTVANRVTALINALTPSQMEYIEGPEGPVDRIKARRKSLSNALVDAALGYQEVVSSDDV